LIDRFQQQWLLASSKAAYHSSSHLTPPWFRWALPRRWLRATLEILPAALRRSSETCQWEKITKSCERMFLIYKKYFFLNFCLTKFALYSHAVFDHTSSGLIPTLMLHRCWEVNLSPGTRLWQSGSVGPFALLHSGPATRVFRCALSLAFLNKW